MWFILFQVEHVVREEKMMAAYELVEIFCELIAARFPIIESQKYVAMIIFISSNLSFFMLFRPRVVGVRLSGLDIDAELRSRRIARASTVSWQTK